VLEFGDNDVDCERVVEIVMFVRVGVAFDEVVVFVVFASVGDGFGEIDCGDVVEFVAGTFIVEGVDIGMFGGGGEGRGILKISTTSEYPLFELFPPPKKILFVDDVDTI
jgi:hypothetical protein